MCPQIIPSSPRWRRRGSRILEVENELQRAFDPAFGIAGQRPVAIHAKTAADQGKKAVDPHQKVIGCIAKYGNPAGMPGDLVVLVPVDKQEAAAIHQFADVLTSTRISPKEMPR